jgi:hypothetical protein
MDPNTGGAYPPPSVQRKTSPWLYVGCGCAVLLVICILAFFFIGKKFMDEGRKIAQGVTDPKAAEQGARDTLGFTELPTGYYPAGAFSIPFVMDMAFLGDRPFVGGEQHHGINFEERGFIFIKMLHGSLPTDEAGRRRMLTGSNNQWQQGSGFTIRSQEELGTGEIDAGGAHLEYRSTRGQVQINNHSHQGITDIVIPECPDGKIRIGIWFGPDPAPGEATASLDKTGTPADPKALADFLNHFKLCTGGG